MTKTENDTIAAEAVTNGVAHSAPHEPARLAVSFGDSRAQIPDDRCIPELVEAQVRRTPDAPAAIYGKERLTYRALNERAESLAGVLKQLGVGPDVPVAICVERSLEMIIGVLGILKAGGAYVPLDPAYPKERLRLMLENARVPLLLTQTSLRRTVEFGIPNLKVLCTDESISTTRNGQHPTTKTLTSSATNLAYIIHTSGSTGTPKGVAMPHRPLVNLLEWQLESSRLGRGARTLQFSSLSFDVSFQEIFSTWGAGGTLVLIDENLRRDPVALLDFITRQKIERLFLPFIALQQLAESFDETGPPPACLREIITAGEQLQITPKIVRFFERLPDCTLHNHYGPSESHVVTAFTLNGPPKQWPALPSIGRPIPSARIYLLDEQRRPVTPGEAGEIYIGGDCLARGYLHRPDLTAERFIPDPFSDDPEAKVYKTGDLGRCQPDGNIEFLGRVDHQVKIRGYRIELGEIEATLREHSNIRDAVVVAREDQPGNKRLVGYFVPRAGQRTTPMELRQYLGEKLPEYMVPAFFVPLQSLPLTPSGKVDRNNLPAPVSDPETDSILSEPGTPTEKVLAEIWCDVLGVKRIGIEDDFFAFGGHSLLAAKLIVQIERRLHVTLPIINIFQSPTIKQLAQAVERQGSQSRQPGLLPIQPDGDQAPLFLVHGAGGDVLWGYANLAQHMNRDRPIYGIQSRDGEDFATLEEMALHYVDRIRAFQPIGPYYLGGYCFGGNVAQEMARQLEEQGESVALLALLDCAPSNCGYETLRWQARLPFDFTRNLLYWIQDFSRLKPEERRSLVLRKLRTLPQKVWGRISGRRAQDQFDLEEVIDVTHVSARERQLWKHHLDLLARHVSKAYGGPITLFRTRGHPLISSFEEDFGWGKLSDQTTVERIPGSHEGIFMEPHVRFLARELEKSFPVAHATPAEFYQTNTLKPA